MCEQIMGVIQAYSQKFALGGSDFEDMFIKHTVDIKRKGIILE